MNNPTNSDDPLERRARRRVRAKFAFGIHALVFVLVNLGLYAFGELTGHPRRPFFWGWALALAIHGVVVFVRLQSEGLRERMLRKEIEQLRFRKGH